MALPGANLGGDRAADAARVTPRGGGVVAPPGGGPRRSLPTRAGRWVVVVAFSVLLAFPFYWMLITSFKRTSDLYNTTHNPFVFGEPPTLDHLRLLFGQTLFLRWFLNTTVVGAVVVLVTLLLATPAAYALTRLTGRWGARLGMGIFLTYLIPPTLLFLPLSRVVARLGLQDSLWSIILVYPTFTVPFSIWLLMGFFKSIPRDIEDAALVDGLSRFQTFLKVIIPISRSGIITVVIFTFALVTQEFVYALTFISSAAHQTVGVGVPIYLVRGDVYYWGSLMAACLIASLPIAFVYNLFLDRFIAGFTVGAVK
jgi:multiple sugar transport system permease protein